MSCAAGLQANRRINHRRRVLVSPSQTGTGKKTAAKKTAIKKTTVKAKKPSAKKRASIKSQSSASGASLANTIRKTTSRKKATTQTPDAVKKLLSLLVKQLDADKAEQITTIDLAGKTDFADAMILASGRSGRHVGALADKIARCLKAEGVDGIAVEGMSVCDWVLIDAHDIIIHLFRPEVRAFYDLERIWLDEDVTHPAQDKQAP